MKIQDGCNRFCSYCIVPYVRGRPRSRPLSSIVDEAKALALMGFKEIVLCGINLGAYGEDLDGKVNLLKVIMEIEGIDGIERIRLSSLEPDTIGDELIESFSKNKKLCPHIHIPLQSGDDELLARMGRHYTRDDFRDLVAKLREALSEISITTDIMVGFPGEDERSFFTTYEFIKEIGFSSIHVFRYSQRPGTLAYELNDHISPKKKEERSKVLDLLSKELNLRYRKRFWGKETSLLIEGKGRDGFIGGFTPNYIHIHLDEPLPKDSIINVRIVEVVNGSTFGKRI